MGLDQYAYIVRKHEGNTDFSVHWLSDNVSRELRDRSVVELTTWRKHPYLQGWMEVLFNRKADAQGYEGYLAPDGLAQNVVVNVASLTPEGSEAPVDPEFLGKVQEAASSLSDSLKEMTKNAPLKRVFNQQCVRLTLSDLEQLETAVIRGELPESSGFFWGDNSSEEYKEHDLQFIKDAREAINNGMDIYYDSWW